jgi:ornithine carbamoyltransferase
MWQRFTERARRVVFFAQEEAGKLGENYVSTEHLLLGLVRESDSVAARILDRMDISREAIQHEIIRQVTHGDGRLGQDMQLTPRAKRVIDLAYDEARQLSNNYIGTEHLLLGLIREGEGLAGRVLAKMGVELDRTRAEVRVMQDNDGGAGSTAPAPPASTPTILSRHARLAVSKAYNRASRLKMPLPEATELDLLLELLGSGDGSLAEALAAHGVDVPALIRSIQSAAEVAPLETDNEKKPVAIGVVIRRTIELMKTGGANELQALHLMLALAQPGGDGVASEILAAYGVDAARITECLEDESDSPVKPSPDQPDTRLKTIEEILNGSGISWRGRSLVTLQDVTAVEIKAVLDLAAIMKLRRKLARTVVAAGAGMRGRTLALVFDKPSLRTRVSFETAMAHLGGTAIHLGPAEIGLGKREPVEDVASGLSRWVDVIAARVFAHETVEQLAKYATIPVINALTDREHPLQAFADLLTLQEHKGELGNNLKLAYLGDGNNVLHSLLLACAKVGVNLSAACPDGYWPDPAYVAEAERIAAETGATVTITTDPATAVADADALYTDVWASMGQESEAVARRQIFKAYQINAELVIKAKPDAIVMHCLPAHRGEEIAADVMDKYHKVIFDEAENRMHTQQALLMLILGF